MNKISRYSSRNKQSCVFVPSKSEQKKLLSATCIMRVRACCACVLQGETQVCGYKRGVRWDVFSLISPNQYSERDEGRAQKMLTFPTAS